VEFVNPPGSPSNASLLRGISIRSQSNSNSDFQVSHTAFPDSLAKANLSTVRGAGCWGSLHVDKAVLEAGSWQELQLSYCVGRAGLAKHGTLRLTFRPDSDWADFQTRDPSADNYLSVEFGSSERPFSNVQMAALTVSYERLGQRRSIVITVVRGKLRGGDLVHLRLGDKRRGGRGTRVQTFAEKEFHWRAFVCPDGTSACCEVDLVDHIVIQPGPMSALRIIAPPAMTTGASLPVMVRAEDAWGNVSLGVDESASLEVFNPNRKTFVSHFRWNCQPWAIYRATINLEVPGKYHLRARSGACRTKFLVVAQDSTDATSRHVASSSSSFRADNPSPIEGEDLHVIES
jgi:hypothetical protein